MLNLIKFIAFSFDFHPLKKKTKSFRNNKNNIKQMTQKVLPGFTGIEFGNTDRLFIYKQELIKEGSIIEAYGKFTDIPVVSLISCKVTTEIISGETIYTTVLNFMMKDCKDYTRRLIHDLTMIDGCFRLTDVYKEKYLLGLNDKPHPIVKPSFKSDELPSGQRVFNIEIQYINTHSILQLK
jgi:hypothetical protein